jgi:hypothetical protein
MELQREACSVFGATVIEWLISCASQRSLGEFRMGTTEYNELKAAIGHRDTLRAMASAALADNMPVLVAKLVECDVLPKGTRAQRPSVIHEP